MASEEDVGPENRTQLAHLICCLRVTFPPRKNVALSDIGESSLTLSLQDL